MRRGLANGKSIHQLTGPRSVLLEELRVKTQLLGKMIQGFDKKSLSSTYNYYRRKLVGNNAEFGRHFGDMSP